VKNKGFYYHRGSINQISVWPIAQSSSVSFDWPGSGAGSGSTSPGSSGSGSTCPISTDISVSVDMIILIPRKYLWIYVYKVITFQEIDDTVKEATYIHSSIRQCGTLKR